MERSLAQRRIFCQEISDERLKLNSCPTLLADVDASGANMRRVYGVVEREGRRQRLERRGGLAARDEISKDAVAGLLTLSE